MFTRSGGLESGNDIRISGIKVGSVVGLDLTPDYTAEVTMNIREGVRLPADTTAVVTTDGLMGGTFVQLEPGKSKEILKAVTGSPKQRISVHWKTWSAKSFF